MSLWCSPTPMRVGAVKKARRRRKEKKKPCVVAARGTYLTYLPTCLPTYLA